MSVNYYKMSKAADKLGIAQSTLRRWEAEGKINCLRTPGGQRMLDISSICPNLLLQQQAKQCDKIILYARVSSAKQRNDLSRQQEYLRTHPSVKEGGSQNVQEISDVGSGLNFKRRGLLRILGLVKNGEVSKIVVASRDRMARFGYELIEWICNEFGTQIVVLDQTDTTPEEELGKDLMSIVQVYCCRWNGKRRYKEENSNEVSEIETETITTSEEEDGSVGGVLSFYLQQGDSTAIKQEESTQTPDCSAKSPCYKKEQRKRKSK